MLSLSLQVYITASNVQCIPFEPSTVSIATHISLIVADIIVLSVTWRHTFQHTREAWQTTSELQISDVVLRDRKS